MCHVILDVLIQLEQETVIDVMRCSRGKQTVQELQLFICKHTCSPDDDCTSRVCSLKIYLPGIEPRVPGHQSSTTTMTSSFLLLIGLQWHHHSCFWLVRCVGPSNHQTNSQHPLHRWHTEQPHSWQPLSMCQRLQSNVYWLFIFLYVCLFLFFFSLE